MEEVCCRITERACSILRREQSSKWRCAEGGGSLPPREAVRFHSEPPYRRSVFPAHGDSAQFDAKVKRNDYAGKGALPLAVVPQVVGDLVLWLWGPKPSTTTLSTGNDPRLGAGVIP